MTGGGKSSLGAAVALAVFMNVVLRYGFGSGVAASEELWRLLFVWMVFIGASVGMDLWTETQQALAKLRGAK
jgi:TRAP-type C4-dicarboxylate transport system permease small subunit